MRHAITRLTAALSLAMALGALSANAIAQDTDPAKLEEAKRHMEAGAAFYNDPNGHKCEEAYREFKRAYELSSSLNALKAMGVCALELERDGDAISHYEKYIERKGASIDAADKSQIETDLKALKSSVAWVTISTDRPNVQIIDTRTPTRGFPVTNRYVGSVGGTKIGLHPGSHVITARSEGAPDLVWSVELSHGAANEHFFQFDKGKPITAEGFPPGDIKDKTTPPEGGSRPVPATVFIFGGLTIAAGAAMAGTMVTASGKKSDYDEMNGNIPTAEAEALRSDVTTMNLVSDILLGVTGASAVATAIFFFTRPTVAAEEPKTGSFMIYPAVGRESGGAMVLGSF